MGIKKAKNPHTTYTAFAIFGFMVFGCAGVWLKHFTFAEFGAAAGVFAALASTYGFLKAADSKKDTTPPSQPK